MNIDAITQLILTLTPAITAVIGIITALGVGIAKIKSGNANLLKEVKDNNKNLRTKNDELSGIVSGLLKENAELKENIKEINAKLDKVHISKKKEK